MEPTTIIIADDLNLTFDIGQALTANQFKRWEVLRAADKGHYLSDRLQPSYIILDTAVIKGNLGIYCADLAEKCKASIILIMSQESTPATQFAVKEAQAWCDQIIGAYEPPVDVGKLVARMVRHRDHGGDESEDYDIAPTPVQVTAQDADPSAVTQWIRDHPDIVSCVYLSLDGEVQEQWGPVEAGQGRAAHRIMMIGRALGEELGLSGLTQVRQQGSGQKFLTIDTGEHLVALSAKEKADLGVFADSLNDF